MFNVLMTWFNARIDVAQEEGQTLVEYGLILALIAVVVIGALGALGGGVDGILDTVTGGLAGA